MSANFDRIMELLNHPTQGAGEPEQDREATLEESVFKSLGMASMCWEFPERAGAFDSERAKQVGDRLLIIIRGARDA